jgi:hypothetical protein
MGEGNALAGPAHFAVSVWGLMRAAENLRQVVDQLRAENKRLRLEQKRRNSLG